ncbi:MAG: hypothetical protein HY392_04380 [Candidatus Diapherotrites archaeon]|nr:hypothetical protein [Candidatus Diapherotrites archaeon]
MKLSYESYHSRTRSGNKTGITYKCLNCGNFLDNPTGSPEARRFCDMKCKDEYMRHD